jgi:hypothetical protein
MILENGTRQGRVAAMRKLLGLLSVIALTAGISTGANAVNAFSYSVKFVCGFPDTGADDFPVVSGEYATAINIFDPNTTGQSQISGTAYLTSIDGDGSSSDIGDTFDRAFEIDCFDLFELFAQNGSTASFLKGVLQILSDRRLDVIAVYTAREDSETDDVSIDVEYVVGRRILRDTAGVPSQ